MKKIEKYPSTKDALEAYNTIGDKRIPFNDWLELEYKDTLPPTLLEAASDAVDEFDGYVVKDNYVVKGWYKYDGNFGEKMRVLRSAIEREDAKPIRNCDKYNTFKDASVAFEEMCSKQRCKDCKLDRLRIDNVCNCIFIWLYKEADKEVDE